LAKKNEQHLVGGLASQNFGNYLNKNQSFGHDQKIVGYVLVAIQT
jgi:hypothetical protein